MKIETDIRKIEAIARKKATENSRFRMHLKACDETVEEIDAVVHEIYNEIVPLIDCQKCANCCRTMFPGLNETDVRVFAQGLGISIEQMEKQYLITTENPDDEPDPYWTFKRLPCPFLKDNRCQNYDYRPETCRSFPHLHKSEFISRLIGVIENYAVCPLVFNVYERLKGIF